MLHLDTLCTCRCHTVDRADQRQAMHAESWDAAYFFAQRAQELARVKENTADTSDPVAAVLACEKCVNNHCPALLNTMLPNPRWPREMDLSGGDATAWSGEDGG